MTVKTAALLAASVAVTGCENVLKSTHVNGGSFTHPVADMCNMSVTVYETVGSSWGPSYWEDWHVDCPGSGISMSCPNKDSCDDAVTRHLNQRARNRNDDDSGGGSGGNSGSEPYG